MFAITSQARNMSKSLNINQNVLTGVRENEFRKHKLLFLVQYFPSFFLFELCSIKFKSLPLIMLDLTNHSH